MEKIDGQTVDITLERIEQLRAVFPEVFKDGKIDFDTLQNVLGEYVRTLGKNIVLLGRARRIA